MSDVTVAPPATDLLRTEGVTKHFPLKRSARREGDGPAIRAVDDVDLSVPPGTTVGLVGESGSGKSTLARLVLRLLPVTSGRVFFDGVDITDTKGAALRSIRDGMQLVFQDPYSSFDPQATVLDSVIEPLRAQNTAKKACEVRARPSCSTSSGSRRSTSSAIHVSSPAVSCSGPGSHARSRRSRSSS